MLVIQQPFDPFGTLVSVTITFFMGIIVTMCWSIVTVRNDAIFQHVQPSVHHCKTTSPREFAEVILRAKQSSSPLFAQWLEAYV
jgi:hypothetical protein